MADFVSAAHMIEKDPVALTRMTHAEYATLGGMESSEIIMWLVMRGALSAGVRKVHESYYLPSMTAIATAIYEDEAEPPSARELAEQRAKIARQLAGVEALEGTYPFDLERSVGHYRINRFLHDLVSPAHRERFLADPERAFDAAGLSEEERDLVRRRDWRGLMHYGAIFFVLEKLAAVSGVPNPAVYAAMRGQTLEDFQKTRNAAVTYGVAAPAAPGATRA